MQRGAQTKRTGSDHHDISIHPAGVRSPGCRRPTADVRLTATMVQFFIGGQLIKTHPRKMRGKQTDFGDYRRRRSRSICAPRPGAAVRPPPSTPRVSRSSPGCWPTTRSTGSALPRA